VIDLAPLVDKKIRVKFVGGREVVGVLRGADPICNIVLDDTIEYLRGKLDLTQILTLPFHNTTLERR
jgi:U6 snRNA-associated Sm-like protein LSm7